MQHIRQDNYWNKAPIAKASRRCRSSGARPLRNSASVIALALLVSGCAPTVKVEAPDKPIEITMNVNINHEIRVKVDKDIEELVEENPDLY